MLLLWILVICCIFLNISNKNSGGKNGWGSTWKSWVKGNAVDTLCLIIFNKRYFLKSGSILSPHAKINPFHIGDSNLSKTDTENRLSENLRYILNTSY